MSASHTEQELYEARRWAERNGNVVTTRVLEGVRYGNHAAEVTLVGVWRTHQPRQRGEALVRSQESR